MTCRHRLGRLRPGIGFFAVSFRRPANPIPPHLHRRQTIHPVEVAPTGARPTAARATEVRACNNEVMRRLPPGYRKGRERRSPSDADLSAKVILEPVRLPRERFFPNPGWVIDDPRFFSGRGRNGGDRSGTRAASSNVDRLHPAHQIRNRPNRHHPRRDGDLPAVGIKIGVVGMTPG